MRRTYFIQAINGGPIKIGSTENPESRLAAFSGMSPYRLRLLLDVPGEQIVERWFHWKFRAHRSHGEWFHPVPELLEAIELTRLHGRHPDAPVAPVCSEDERLTCRFGEIRELLGMSHADMASLLGMTPEEVAKAEAYGPRWSVIFDLWVIARERGIQIEPRDFWRAVPLKRYQTLKGRRPLHAPCRDPLAKVEMC